MNGELAASFALGVANEATGQPLTPRHLFRIASHSKTFTATAIFQLVENWSRPGRCAWTTPRAAGCRNWRNRPRRT
ncbi:serine hydrolase [Deinococcus yavapaiensis]|uniref:serine hydrolase n=1 Tax=Deinococcus yavapaiensis TaxID=309889 RepID=UPI002482C504|nr:serine hydrolase [Deinococcus yavapaiensis]